MKTKIYEYILGPFIGRASTKKEAQGDAEAQANLYLERWHDPIILSHRGNTAIIYITAWGSVQSSLLGPITNELTGICVQGNIISDSQAFNKAINSVKYHLAQLGWNGAETTSTYLSTLPEKYQQEFSAWVRFQLAYKQLKVTCPELSENELHQKACEAMYS